MLIPSLICSRRLLPRARRLGFWHMAFKPSRSSLISSQGIWLMPLGGIVDIVCRCRRVIFIRGRLVSWGMERKVRWLSLRRLMDRLDIKMESLWGKDLFCWLSLLIRIKIIDKVRMILRIRIMYLLGEVHNRRLRIIRQLQKVLNKINK